MKTCTCCNTPKLFTEYNFSNKPKGWLRSECKDCQNIKRALYYTANRKYAIEYTTARQARILEDNRNNLLKYLSVHHCIDCACSNPVVLTFDHREPAAKEYNISEKMDKYTWDKLLLEINKCDVRCCNCHTERTAKQFNWYKYNKQSSPQSSHKHTEAL